MSKVRELYLDIKYGVRNLIKWFPVIWNDRDWDYVFLMIILNKKLRAMSDLHYKYGNSVNSSKYAMDLLIASKLADRISEEDYSDEAFKDKDYLRDKGTVDFIPLDNGGYKVLHIGLTEEEKEEIMELYTLEDELLERDINLLFNMMKKDLLKWWD